MEVAIAATQVEFHQHQDDRSHAIHPDFLAPQKFTANLQAPETTPRRKTIEKLPMPIRLYLHPLRLFRVASNCQLFDPNFLKASPCERINKIMTGLSSERLQRGSARTGTTIGYIAPVDGGPPRRELADPQSPQLKART